MTEIFGLQLGPFSIVPLPFALGALALAVGVASQNSVLGLTIEARSPIRRLLAGVVGGLLSWLAFAAPAPVPPDSRGTKLAKKLSPARAAQGSSVAFSKAPLALSRSFASTAAFMASVLSDAGTASREPILR